MTRLSSKGTVPVLQLTNGKIIDESLDVMLWALTKHDPDSWLDCDLIAAKELIAQNDFSFKQNLDHYKYHVRFPEQTKSYYRQCGETFLQILEQCLLKHHGKGLMSDTISFADVAIFPFIRQFAHVDWQWFANSQYQDLRLWLETFQQSNAFLAVMQKHPPWQRGDDIILFN